MPESPVVRGELASYLLVDREFWTASQVAAFLAAHAKVDGQPPGKRAAVAWKRQKSRAFRIWRATPRSERRRLIEGERRKLLATGVARPGEAKP